MSDKLFDSVMGKMMGKFGDDPMLVEANDREKKIKAIWRKIHRDYRGSSGRTMMTPASMQDKLGATVDLDKLSDDWIDRIYQSYYRDVPASEAVFDYDGSKVLFYADDDSQKRYNLGYKDCEAKRNPRSEDKDYLLGYKKCKSVRKVKESVIEHLEQVSYKGLVIRLDRGQEMCKWDVANYQTGFVLDRGQSDTYDEALEDAKKFADSVGKNEAVTEAERYVQIRNPKTGDYTKIDQKEGKVVGHSKTKYEGIKQVYRKHVKEAVKGDKKKQGNFHAKHNSESSIPCSDCDGQGYHMAEFEGKKEKRECEWCHGTGKVRESVNELELGTMRAQMMEDEPMPQPNELAVEPEEDDEEEESDEEFRVGDKVSIEGAHRGGEGFISSVSPSGSFYGVKDKNAVFKGYYHGSNLHLVEDEFDEEMDDEREPEDEEGRFSFEKDEVEEMQEAKHTERKLVKSDDRYDYYIWTSDTGLEMYNIVPKGSEPPEGAYLGKKYIEDQKGAKFDEVEEKKMRGDDFVTKSPEEVAKIKAAQLNKDKKESVDPLDPHMSVGSLMESFNSNHNEACGGMSPEEKKWKAIRGNMSKKAQKKMAKKAAKTRAEKA